MPANEGKKSPTNLGRIQDKPAPIQTIMMKSKMPEYQEPPSTSFMITEVMAA